MLSSKAAGFTLTELLIATAAMSLILFYSLGTFTVQHQTYVVVDQVSETQQNIRAVAALMERDIRNSGYMVPAAAASCGVDGQDKADVLYVSDTDAILPLDQLPTSLRSTDLGAVAQSTGVSGGVTTLALDDVVIDQTASYDTDGDGTNDSDFRVGAGAILVDTANSDRGTSCGVVSAVNVAGSIGVQLANALDGTITNPEELVVVPAHLYQIASPGGGAPNEIRRDGALLAKDVEDLQVAWFYDDDANGQADAGEYRGVPGTAYTTSAVDGEDLREVRINLVATTRQDDPRNPTAAGTGQATENRTANVPGDDGRRRRVHSATVSVRNVGL